MSEARGSGLECQAVMAQERPRGATLRPRGATALPRSVVAAGRSHLAPEARVGDPEEPPRAQGQRRQHGGAIRGVVVRRHRRA